MKKIVLSLLLVFAVNFAMAQEQSTEKTTKTKATSAKAQKGSAATEEAIKKMERDLWDAWKNKDMKPFESMIADDAMTLDMAQGWQNKSQMIKSMTDMPCDVKSYSFADEKISWLNKDTALYTYTASADATCGGQKAPDKVYASSVWSKRGAKWEGTFHQETPAVAPPPKS
jgi:ketosteroid isomerase-like protein